ARGQPDAALARCETLAVQRVPVGDATDRQLQAEIELQAATIALHAGALGRVRTWLDSRLPSAGRERGQLDREQLLVARVHLLDGDPRAAVGLANAVLGSAVTEGRGRVTLEAQAVLALAYAADDQLPQAQSVLVEALTAAEPMAARR